MGHARALLGAVDEKAQLKLFNKIIEHGWSVRKIEDEMKGKDSRKSGKSSSSTPSSLRGNAAFNQIETRLRHKFGTKITVRKNSSGGGEIGIEFYNADDLERLIDLLDS